MIHDVDESLRALIRREVLNGGGVDISFEAPTKEWAAKRTVPTVNVYLYDIREDTSRREVFFEDVRDDNGRVTERRQPPRRFRLSYLLTAWTQRPEDEHRLLSALLGCFLAADTLPVDVMPDALVAQGRPVLTSVALPPSEDRSLSDVWSALGGELKPSLDLAVIAPFDVGRAVPVGPPVEEEPRIRVTRPEVAGAEEPGAARRRGTKGAPAVAVESDAAEPDAPAGAVVTDETIRSGAEDKPGRVIRLRTMPP